MRVLFIAWDGPHQNYLESLFLPIFARLEHHGFKFHAMQFRWAAPAAIASARKTAAGFDIPYQHERILRRPKVLATAGTVALGAMAIARYVRKHDIDIVMPRSTLPAAMVLLARRHFPKTRVLFDADGFTPDERVDFAGWRPGGVMYRLFRDAEAQAVRVADSVVTRTEKGRRILVARAGAGTSADKIFVIPNGKDEDLFSMGTEGSRAATRSALGISSSAPLLVYAGSLGPQYYPDEMFGFFRRVLARHEDAHMVVLTGQEDVARTAFANAGLPPGCVTISRVAADTVPNYLAAADLGLGLREARFSQQGVSPIKVGEYLLCGTPVLATRGVGDLDTQLTHEVGYLLDAVDDAGLDAAADWFCDDVLPHRAAFREVCRDRGVEVFSLRRCVERYAAALAL